MPFDVIITKHFEKQCLKKKKISEKSVIQCAREIENKVFRAGEGRVKGSKVLYKKRIQLQGTSKRKGGRLLIVVFHKIKNLYVPYMVWTASDSKKKRIDQQLKDKKVIGKIIQDTIRFMSDNQ